MQKKLDEIRLEIDQIDNHVHDLLMQRAALIASVAAAKKKDGLQVVQPAREARMMRRLLTRHSGPLPRATIVRIWRELVGSVSLLQAGLSVTVVSENDDKVRWNMAKNYFGSAIPMYQESSYEKAVHDLEEEKVSFLVLPWPKNQKWWVTLLGRKPDQKLSIICLLPYVLEDHESSNIEAKSVVLSKINFMPSDQDNSFIGFKVEQEITLEEIENFASKAGIAVINIFYEKNNYLMECEGFIEQDSGAAVALYKQLGSNCTFFDVLGGYPVMPDIS